jgi:hypothetical protein
VNLSEGGETFAVVATGKLGVDALVGVYAEGFSEDLHGEHLAVGEGGFRPALAEAPPFEPVVDQAEAANDEGALRSIMRRPPRFS